MQFCVTWEVRVSRCLFLTGASGFLGQYLFEALARQRPRDSFLVLARPVAAKKLRERFAWMEPERLQIIGGDITQPGLGLMPQDLVRVREQTNEVWHLAASTSFNESEAAQIEEANLGGTARVLELARQVRSLDNFYHVSTAYIAGRNHPHPTEDALPESPHFNNTYERTKWEAEQCVRESGLPFTVFRPSIIMGESSGASSGEKRMMYGYVLGLYCALAREFLHRGLKFRECWLADRRPEVPLRLVGHNTTRKNYVCVDDVASAILAILRAPHQGRAFNIVNPRHLLGAEVGPALEEALRIRGLRYVGDAIPDPTPTEQAMMKHSEAFAPYTVHSDPLWPTENTDRTVNGHHRRVVMSPDFFTFLLRRFVEQEIIRKDSSRA
jgi:nucleoside-diphosphate-sugar epimerase